MRRASNRGGSNRTKLKTASEIRRAFLDYFAAHEHRIVPSAPVVPGDDPTLLFTNAGMNQFKDVFLGTGKRDYSRAADTQKCIRVSGKHNDLEEVGLDTYHHTFFEMLGNWSFGDYFKREAIRWAWELLTDIYGLPKERLWATVFGGDKELGLAPDEEAAALWTEETGIPKERVLRCGRKDNFWEMGETGPCGPCSEIHFDLGEPSCNRKEVPGHVCKVNGDCTRFIEIWNLVFIQFNRTEGNCLSSLPARHVDTGMGLERLVATVQGKTSNYDTDLFLPIIRAIEEMTGARYGADGRTDTAIRVVADHVRALSVAIADGAMPDRKKRGSVLRSLLRRAARFGRQVLACEDPFIYRLVPVVADIFSDVFPEIGQRRAHIELVVKAEEESFAQTVGRGIARFEELAAGLASRKVTVIDGRSAYRLYHQDGFPRDLIDQMARERGLRVDEEGWKVAEEEHKKASEGEAALPRFDLSVLAGIPATKFLGYWERTEAEAGGTRAEAAILKVIGNEAVILDRTPFYAEAGGQVGDSGVIAGDHFRFRVHDTGRVGDVTVHYGEFEDFDLSRLPAQVTAVVDRERRAAIMANHTATHLLHWALKKVLGPHANQQGSLVHPDYLRFDFTHPKAITAAELDEIEVLVNERIAGNFPLKMTVEALAAAKEKGVTALFGEKYGEKVRVVSIEDTSQELCGGTHCTATGDIGYFRIVSESSIQVGVRRIVAKTRLAAVRDAQSDRKLLKACAVTLSVPPAELPARIEGMREQMKELRKRGEKRAQEDVGDARREILEKAEMREDVYLVACEAPGCTRETLAELADALRSGKDPVAGILYSRVEGTFFAQAFASKSLSSAGRFDAGKAIRELAARFGQRGGGRPDFAQAGWKREEPVDAALQDAVRETVAGNFNAGKG
jgi:alanyl-tRNA synthetase